MLTSILELGAWVGTLANGYLADALGRRLTVLVAVVVFCVGVIVQACTENKDFVFGGRFVTGLGVGSLSMVVPLYNAELAPPEIRGSLVAVQQLAITFGIMVSFWVCRVHSREILNPDVCRLAMEQIILAELGQHNRMLHGWSQSVFKSCPLWSWLWA